ncbi:hypothetical protein L6164_032489 [Bauhinia variegata]|uniref:Uncharacterized protein n=1 Tax=Bauhinia variegata TaxID=167791 RepID=A0ACB9KNU1_BAUVA|nr:hypothetical protein L6164_032489 [Bauhinia variegata]
MAKSKSEQASKKEKRSQKKTSRVKKVAKKARKEDKVGQASGSAAAPARTKRTRRTKNSKPSEGKQGLCTNYLCRKTWDTTWRKGPLGPRTLCNACGLQYIKIVSSRGSGVTNSSASASASDDQKK